MKAFAFTIRSIRILLTLFFISTTYFISSCDNLVQNPDDEDNTGNTIEHNSSITKDETWANDKTHVISGYVSISNATVTIEAGAVVVFKQNADLDVATGGGLIADGTTAPITFTGETKQTGFWDYLEFSSDAINANCILNNCIIEYGGGYSNSGAMLYIDNGATVTNCTIRYSASSGVKIDDDASPVFNGNTITLNTNSPILGSFENMASIGQGTYTGNSQDYIDLSSGSISTNALLLKQDIPYRMNGYNSVNNATLTIQAGTVIQMNSGADLDIKTNAGLIANGTAQEPIIFTGAAQQNGYWDYIEFENDAINANCLMNYCTVEYGGGYSSSGAMIYIENSPTITNSTFRNSASNGLKIDNDAHPDFTNNTVTLNDKSPILGAFKSIGSIGVGTYTGNTQNYLDIQSGTLSEVVTLPAQDIPYRLNGYCNVSNAVLTIQPGTVIEMNASADLNIGTGGGINAIGTALLPITITGAAKQKGYWDYFEIDDDAVFANCNMSYCIIEYGGGYSASGAMIYLNSSGAVLNNSTIQHSESWGIVYDSGSNPDLSNNTYADNTLGDFHAN